MQVYIGKYTTGQVLKRLRSPAHVSFCLINFQSWVINICRRKSTLSQDYSPGKRFNEQKFEETVLKVLIYIRHPLPVVLDICWTMLLLGLGRPAGKICPETQHRIAREVFFLLNSTFFVFILINSSTDRVRTFQFSLF